MVATLHLSFPYIEPTNTPVIWQYQKYVVALTMEFFIQTVQFVTHKFHYGCYNNIFL